MFNNSSMQKWLRKIDSLKTLHLREITTMLLFTNAYQAIYEYNSKHTTYCLILASFPDYSYFHQILVFSND